MEGIGHEAVSLASHLKLGHLNVMYDMNSITIDGGTDLSFMDDTAAKLKAMDWHVLETCGHTYSEIDDALSAAKTENRRPTLIIFGLPSDLARQQRLAHRGFTDPNSGLKKPLVQRKNSGFCLKHLTSQHRFWRLGAILGYGVLRTALLEKAVKRSYHPTTLQNSIV